LKINSPEAAEPSSAGARTLQGARYFLERIGKPPNHAIPLLTDQPKKIVANLIALRGATEKIERLSSVVLPRYKNDGPYPPMYPPPA